MPGETSELQLSKALGAALRERGWTCATAESCSAGLVGHIITSIAGSSDYYLGGVIAYSNQAKQDLLDVRSETLESVGAVSRETAAEMAEGARATFAADVGLSTTGIAGPGGATARKPVGLIYVAACTPETSRVRELRLSSDRIGNIEETARKALELTLELIQPVSGDDLENHDDQ